MSVPSDFELELRIGLGMLRAQMRCFAWADCTLLMGALVCTVLWSADMRNSNPQMQPFPSSQLSINSQSSFGGSRGDLPAPREDDVDDDGMENDMMRMLLGESDDHAAGTGQKNVANMMIPSAPNAHADLLLVQGWIREAMPGLEGALVAETFRSEVYACACAHAPLALRVSRGWVPGGGRTMMIHIHESSSVNTQAHTGSHSSAEVVAAWSTPPS